jgi:carbonic anhydrase/acetyltransferase-like protein (isoleucine patch superfamily)
MQRIRNYFQAANATVVGNILIADGVNIWYGCVLRGDVAQLTLGKNVNIQDGTIMHADPGYPNEIEEGVVVGHAAIIHGSKVGRGSLIGMGATLLGRSVIGEECIIAARSLITEGAIIPPRSLVMGMPGKVVRQVTDEEVEKIRKLNEHYLGMAAAHADGKYPNVSGSPPFLRGS